MLRAGPADQGLAARPRGGPAPGWAEALAAFDAAIASANAGRIEKKGSEAKLFVPLAGGLNPQPISTLLDLTVFHVAARERPDGLDPEGLPAAKRIPSDIAKAAREAVREGFSTWLKALAAWRARGEAGEGRPRMPGFAKRGTLPGFAFPLTESTQRFPSLAKFAMRTGEDKAGVLPDADKEGWAAFGLRAAIGKAVAAWAKGDPSRAGAAAKSVRIAFSGKKLRMSAALAVPRRHPEGSFLWELARREPEAWAEMSPDPDLLEAWVRELIAPQAWLGAATDPKAPHAWISQNFEVAGVDPGLGNLAAMGRSCGAPMLAFSGKAFGDKVAEFDERIEKLASRLAGPELRALASKIQKARDAGSPVAAADNARRRELAQALWQDGRILALRRGKKAYSTGEAHRLASAIAKAAAAGRAAAVVLSRNPGMKKQDMGRAGNKRAHNVPHGLLAALLREKLDALGVALVETEESWTSQASFVDSDPMPVHPAGAKGEAAKARKAEAKLAKLRGKTEPPKAGPPETPAVEIKPAAAPEAPAPFLREKKPKRPKAAKRDNDNKDPQQTKPPPSFSGAREASDRNRFVRHRPLDASARPEARHRRRAVHADGQAALNAIRKVCPAFACSAKVSLRHQVMLLRAGRWRLWEPA